MKIQATECPLLFSQVQKRSNAKLLRSLTCLAFSIVFSIAGGCASSPSHVDDDAKITALRSIMCASAARSVEQAKTQHDELTELHYRASISPELTNGFVESGEGGNNLLDLGVPGDIGVMYAKETISTADAAVVTKVSLSKSGKVRISNDMFVWREGHWIRAADAATEMLKQLDPKEAAQIEQLTAQTGTNSTRP
jgi:hypothetical protein